ncbi:pre-mRNA-processing factor 19 [Danaus plexippus]|uniref:pre-mRNA-processing factor 19 n=1 Tax=Danaus plexippus TaxID=13037 RepID=UPI002AB0F662|nr:pre-mRNA-processing factor 19 [Danaus plexippus]
MALYCAISNEVPEVPVVSPSSGSVFEKRIIEKYIIENGVDPISGKELRVEDLIEIKTPAIVKPKPPSATSIPATLKSMQDEWDALMLHTFTQRQQLQTARQELSHALYQHDAACRVIARLTKEVTAAREALATLKPQAGLAAPQPASQVEAAAAGAAAVGMSPEVVSRLQDRATALTQERKRRGRTVPEGLVGPDTIRSFVTLASHPGLHSASVPGILALDINPSDHSRILTGGNDRNATVFNKDTEQVVAILKGHTKKVTRVIYHPDEDTVITASPDHTIRVWNVPTSQTTVLLRSHEGPVTGLSLHPTGDYVLSTSTDQHWAFSDIRTGQLLTKVSDASGVSLTTAQFHPDGLIFGTGTENSQVKIWDLKEQSNVANFPGHVGPVTSISFSENGYYLATAAEDACVKLWDLRKLKNFKSIQLDEGYVIRELRFDQSGTYLGVAGSDVRVFLCRQWQELRVLADHTAAATGLRFGRDAAYLASTSMDRTLKIYGLQ